MLVSFATQDLPVVETTGVNTVAMYAMTPNAARCRKRPNTVRGIVDQTIVLSNTNRCVQGMS